MTTRIASVLHVVPTYYPAVRYGGPIVSVHALAAATAARGVHVDVATTSVDGDADSDVPLDRPLERDGVHVWYARSTRLRRLYWSPALGRRIDERAAAADIVHSHAAFLWPGVQAAKVARRSGRPLVISPRGMLVPELVDARGRWRKRAWISLFERRHLAQAAAIHVTSRRERDDLLRLVDGRLPTIAIVPNGVEVPERLDGDRSRRRIVFLGRISWKKRIDWLVASLVNFPDVELVVAGPDDERLTPTLREQAARLGVASRVSLVGPVHGDAKQQLLSSATLLAVPSMSENFGNVVVEAMAHGCAVVCTPGVGASEWLLDADAGVVAGDRREDFSATLGARLADVHGTFAMGARGRAFAQARLTWSSVAARMLDVYEDARISATRRARHVR